MRFIKLLVALSALGILYFLMSVPFIGSLSVTPEPKEGKTVGFIRQQAMQPDPNAPTFQIDNSAPPDIPQNPELQALREEVLSLKATLYADPCNAELKDRFRKAASQLLYKGTMENEKELLANEIETMEVDGKLKTFAGKFSREAYDAIVAAALDGFVQGSDFPPDMNILLAHEYEHYYEKREASCATGTHYEGLYYPPEESTFEGEPSEDEPYVVEPDEEEEEESKAQRPYQDSIGGRGE